ncbi:RNA polymerase sigma factor [Pseudoduganella sp. OTU4001]|uniref:RNA polymerase sigma factor n=1 Tax=Pseudoduganella sp. OTU4001 TaxID=3043854 RepID=UPI00313E1EE5
MKMTEPTTIADTDLLRQLRLGDASAFRTLYQRHQGALFRFAAMRCGSTDTAADVVQEVFMGLLAGSLAFDATRGALAPFLFGVARNLLLRQEEARRRTASLPELGEDDSELELPDDSAEPLARMLSDERAEDVRRALAQLPPHYRDVVILYELHDLSYVEIASICQIDLGTVRSRLSRARSALVKRLGAHRPTLIDAGE